MGLKWLVGLSLVTMVASQMVGHSTMDDWAYQWYEDEPFTINCQSGMNINSSHYVRWGVPPTVVNFTKHYVLNDVDGIEGAEIKIKMVKPEVHGVYVCNVYYDVDDSFFNKTIFALNYRDVRYKSLGDKYRHNVVVAVVASAVFLVPLLTIVLVYKFNWEARHPEQSAKKKYMYNGDNEMKQTTPDFDLASGVKSPEGKGAYENPTLNTQL